MKSGFLYTIFGVMLLSVSCAALAAEYVIIQRKALDHCCAPGCGTVVEANATLQRSLIPGLLFERVYNARIVRQQTSSGGHADSFSIHKTGTTRSVYGYTNAAIMAAIVGVYAYQHRDDVALVAKNAANGTRKLIKETSHNVNAFIQSKL